MAATDIENALVAYLKATPEVTALIGAGDSARIYPEAASQDPALGDHLVYQEVSFQKVGSLDGQEAMGASRIQVDCYGLTNARAKALARAVRKAKGGVAGGRELDGYEGAWDGVKVWACFVEDRRGDPVPPEHGEAGPYRRRILDVIVHHNEP